MKIDSVLSAQLSARGRWCFAYPAYRHMKFGSIVDGERWLWVEGGAPLHLRKGDFYLLTDGRPYFIASDPLARPVDGVKALSSVRIPSGIMHYGEGEPYSLSVAGMFTFANNDMFALFKMLPPVIIVSSDQDKSNALAHLLPLIAAESGVHSLGADYLSTGLAGLVLVYLLRAHILHHSHSVGWLSATMDKHIGPALSLMYAQVSKPWTVGELAAEVNMSRTAFTELFRLRTGTPPLTFLTRWRILLAKEALRDGEKSLSKLAEKLGYGSATALSIAFKRETGISPRNYQNKE